MSAREVASLDEARQRRAAADPLAYLPGVVPFDRSNPVHVRAWNTIHQLGWSEVRPRDRSPGDD